MTNPGDGWVITIDGPAGSGKSTTARGVASELAFVYLDTGALYRAITVLALEQEVRPEDDQEMKRLLEGCGLKVRADGASQRVWADGRDLTDRLRTPEVDRRVSQVSARPLVRRAMLDVQREQRQEPGLVAEGRDLGTVVFPDAHLKIYLTAELDVRAERRALERRDRGERYDPPAEREILASRDHLDATRAVAPLQKPAGARVVDTTALTIEEQIARVVDLFRALQAA